MIPWVLVCASLLAKETFNPCNGTRGRVDLGWVKANCLDGEQHGQTRTFSKTGKKLCDQNFWHGKQDGRQLCWYDNGRLHRDEFYEKGVRRSFQFWYENGKPFEYGTLDDKGNPIFSIGLDERGEIEYQNGTPSKPLPKDLREIEKKLGTIPESIVERASKYIVSVVGQSYFEKNYVVALSKSGFRNKGEEYSVFYEYASLHRVGAEPFVRVVVRRSPASEPVGYVALLSGGVIREPSMTSEMALDIVGRKNLPDFTRSRASVAFLDHKYFNVSQGWTWVITFPVLSGAHEHRFHELYIDAVDGKMTDNGVSSLR